MPYVVVKNGRYYSGIIPKDELDQRLSWTPYKKEARRYVKRGWAEKAAQKLGASIEEVRK